MGLDTHRPRARLARYLNDQYRGEHRTKRLAADIGCTAKAAENILAEHWPNDLHLGAIIRRFGRDVVDALFLPDIDATLAKLAEEENRLARQLEAASARRRQVEGRTGDGVSQPGPASTATGAPAE